MRMELEEAKTFRNKVRDEGQTGGISPRNCKYIHCTEDTFLRSKASPSSLGCLLYLNISVILSHP